MKLAQIDTSVYYPIEIPSTKKKVKFRPFVVKEEKALLMAAESGDSTTMLYTLEEVVKECVVNCPKNLTTFDLEYLFIQIRSKSVGEQSKIVVKCNHCEADNQITVDLTKVELTSKPVTNKIKLNDKLFVQMRYPSISEVAELAAEKPENQTQRAIASAIECVYFNDEVIRTSETDIKDVEEFILNRTDDELALLVEFIEKIPTVKLQTQYKCQKCGEQNDVEITSLSDFF